MVEDFGGTFLPKKGGRDLFCKSQGVGLLEINPGDVSTSLPFGSFRTLGM